MPAISYKSIALRFITLLSMFTVAATFLSPLAAFASTPVVSAYATGSGDSVQVNVTGDPNSGVVLNYQAQNIGAQMSSLGYTNANGTLSITVSSAAYNIIAGSNFYVTVNGQQSTSMTWPYTNSTGGSFTLTQSNLVLASGQSASVSAINNTYGGNLFLSNNTNPSVATVSINGNQLTVYGNQTGNTTITVCALSNSSYCANLAVTVSGNSQQSLTFSQTNPIFNIGQTTVVTISGGTGSYYVSANSNQNVVQANLVGNVLNLSGSMAGSALITVCSSASSCSTLNVTVGSSGSSYGTLTLSQYNAYLTTGQSLSVSISGGGNYYIANNNYPNIVSAYINGNSVTVQALSAGSASLNICQNGGQCALLQITVSGNGGVIQPSNPFILTHVLSVGQGMNLMLSGAPAPYTLSANSTANFTATLTGGNVLTLVGKAPGTSYVNVCAYGGTCTPVYAVVVNSAQTISTNINTITTGRHKFYYPLTFGARGDEVIELQKRLAEEGVFSGAATGYYGEATMAAVRRYQSAHGLNPLGNLGPGTRELLNQ